MPALGVAERLRTITSTGLLALVIAFSGSLAQEPPLSTTTLFATVENTRTVTSILGDCTTWHGLPMCDALSWGSMSGSPTTTLSPTQTGTTTSGLATSTFSGQSGVPFVLSGRGDLADSFFKFDDTTGAVVMAGVANQRFVSLILDESGPGLLRNSKFLDELVFLRYNETIRDLLPDEDQSILNIIRKVQHDATANVLDNDYPTTFYWNAGTNQPGLVKNTVDWKFYIALPSSRRGRARRRRQSDQSYDIYMLPRNVTIPDGSSLRPLDFVAEQAESYPSSFFTSVPPFVTAPTDTTSEIISPTITNTDTSTVAGGSTQTGGNTGTGTGAGISTGTRTRTGGGTVTNTSTNSGGSANTGTGNPTTGNGPATTSTGGGSRDITASPGSTTDAYDIITEYSLQEYCTQLLSYFSRTTTHIATSTSTSRTTYARFTQGSLIYTETTHVPSYTTATFYDFAPPVPQKKRQQQMFPSDSHNDEDITRYGYAVNTAVAAGGDLHKNIRRKIIRGPKIEAREPPDRLTAYPTPSILSACSRAATSPTALFVISSTQLSVRVSSVPTQSMITILSTQTTPFAIVDGPPVTTQTGKGIGFYRFVHKDDLTDTSGTWYGHYLNGDRDVTIGSDVFVDQRSAYTPYYDPFSRGYFLGMTGGATPPDWGLWFAGTRNPNFPAAARLPNSTNIDSWQIVGRQNTRNDPTGNDVPVLWSYDATKWLFVPSQSLNDSPMSGNTKVPLAFYTCLTAGQQRLYFGPSDRFTGFTGYGSNCGPVGLDALQGFIR